MTDSLNHPITTTTSHRRRRQILSLPNIKNNFNHEDEQNDSMTIAPIYKLKFLSSSLRFTSVFDRTSLMMKRRIRSFKTSRRRLQASFLTAIAATVLLVAVLICSSSSSSRTFLLSTSAFTLNNHYRCRVLKVMGRTTTPSTTGTKIQPHHSSNPDTSNINAEEGHHGNNEKNQIISRDSDDASRSDVDDEQRNLRFAGLGRLFSDYATADVTSSSSSAPTPTNPHIEIVDRMSRSVVAVIGLGGVGSWAAEALCRSGVGHLVLVDLDDICISNTNRQLHTTTSSVGNFKIDEMKVRLKTINPDVEITLVHDFVTPHNVDDILLWKPTGRSTHDGQQRQPLQLTACLDAIDGSIQKSALIASCARHGIPVVTCGGSAGRTDPTKFIVEDMTRVVRDPLLSSCRKILRQQYGFEQGVSQNQKTVANKKMKTKLPRKWNIPCIVSTEPQRQLPQDGRNGSSLRRCDGALGTACFVTGSAGFIAAGKIVEMIAKDQLVAPRKFRGNVELPNEFGEESPLMRSVSPTNHTLVPPSQH